MTKPVTTKLFICFKEAEFIAYFTLVNCWHSTVVTMIVLYFVTALYWYHKFLYRTSHNNYLQHMYIKYDQKYTIHLLH